MDSNKFFDEADLTRLAAAASTRARQALAALAHENIFAKGVRVYHLASPDMLLMRLRSAQHLLTITRPVSGDAAGRVSLVLGQQTALKLVDLLTGQHGAPTRSLGGFELDALKETANIIAGAFLGLLGPALGVMKMPSEASVAEGSAAELVGSLVPQPKAICVESRLSVPSRQVEVALLLAVALIESALLIDGNGQPTD